MKDYKIKFRLEKWGRTLVFQVLDMDKRFRCVDIDNFEYVSSNKFKIRSISSILFSSSGICLWGRRFVSDDKVSIHSFSTKEEMDLYYNKMLFALEDWSENWEGFTNNIELIINQDGIFNFNNKIKFRLDKYDCNLVFQVLSMDERFVAATSYIIRYGTSNGYSVCSTTFPKIGWDSIYLHGYDKDKNNKLVINLFDNNKERDEKYNKILEALDEWSRNWEGFKSNKIESKDGIFTF